MIPASQMARPVADEADMGSRRLPQPQPGREAAEAYVTDHLHGLYLESSPGSGSGPAVGSDRFRGGQSEADRRLAALDLNGYGAGRNLAFPQRHRTASALSPYIRHGLLTLPEVAAKAASCQVADPLDRHRFLTELDLQHHTRSATPVDRQTPLCGGLDTQIPVAGRLDTQIPVAGGLDTQTPGVGGLNMGCVDLSLDELVEDGYLAGQARRWMAAHWASQPGADWRDGEAFFFRHLLDGNRAVNRAAWRRVVGADGTAPYRFTRWQVERRAPGLCASCDRAADCPIETPSAPGPGPGPGHPVLAEDLVEQLAGEALDTVRRSGPAPTRVWLTVESMGHRDPALAANPDIPALFVFDRPLLSRLQLSAKRLVFWVETLAELAADRPIEIHLGSPVEALASHRLAATSTPVPGWRRLASRVRPVEVHPWPWLHHPGADSTASGRPGDLPMPMIVS